MQQESQERTTADHGREVETEGSKKAPGKTKPDDRPSKASFLYEHRTTILIGAVVLVAALVGLGLWWLSVRDYETTDDAFIDARYVPISSQVAGAITNVAVTDNETVEAGTLLVEIDRRDYAAKLAQAEAQIEEAKASVANLAAQIVAQQATIEQAQKNVAQQQASLVFAQEEERRAQELLTRGAGTQQNEQRTSSQLRQDQAQLAGAQSAAIAAQKQIAVLKAQEQSARAQIDSAIAMRDQAAADLSRVTVTAPVAGRVSRLTAAKGQYATVGQALMIMVPRDVWVTANLKETQLADLRPGQHVIVRVDAYPGRSFSAHIDSIQAGSGTVFSLLPAQNATGNYVKVVQRVPVKIVFDEPPKVLLGPGMSAVPWIKVR